jgi:hypothetical protein
VQRDPTLGWNLKTAGNLTVGELYWMLGEEGSAGFQLDYTWQGSSSSKGQEHNNCQVQGRTLCYLLLNFLQMNSPPVAQNNGPFFC